MGKNQPDGEMLKGTLDMMILRTLVAAMHMGIQSPKSLSEPLRTCWRWSRVHCILLCTGWRIADSSRPFGARARTIARRSSIGLRLGADGELVTRIEPLA